MVTKTTDRIRFRYGMCLNDTCEKCKSKEVQEIPARKELVCTVCGKPLRECPPPKKGHKPPVAVLVICGLLGLGIIGGIGYAVIGGKDEKPEQAITEQDTVKADTIAKETVVDKDTVQIEEKETPKEEQVETPEQEETKVAQTKTRTTVQNGYGTIKLAYGSYTGDIKDGKPHGHGKITFSTTRRLVPSKDEMVSAGDTFEGEFRNGQISGPGTLNQNGNVSIFKP